MARKTRREFLKTTLKYTAVAATGMMTSTIDIKFNTSESIQVGKDKKASVGMSEANATCGMGLGCSGGGGQCGMGLGCGGGGDDGGGGGGGQCGMGLGCSGGGGQCGMGLGCGGK